MNTPTRTAGHVGTMAALALFVWAAYGLAQQESEQFQRCLARGATAAECQLRVRGR
jgi:hypothetical protein